MIPCWKLIGIRIFLLRQQLIRQKVNSIQQYFLVLFITKLDLSDEILQFFI